MRDDFAVFILTYRRADNLITLNTLRKRGYTGKIYLVVDKGDPELEKYKQKFRDIVLVFDKRDVKADPIDHTGVTSSVLFARNACYDLAETLGITYFLQLDDDYTGFFFRFDTKFRWVPTGTKAEIRSLDEVFGALLDFYISAPLATLAIAQTGDFMGGPKSDLGKTIKLKRKAMNFFLCSVERRFDFVGILNDDVNTYVGEGLRGLLFLTTNMLYLKQKSTQQSAGGLTGLYKAFGTYVKSFYTVMVHPAGVVVRPMGYNNPRLHHVVSWNHTVPKIISERYRNGE